MKIAAIDIGSNSIHMVIAQVRRSGFQIIDRAKEMVGLGRSTLSTGRLSPAAIDVGFRTLDAFKRLAEKHDADPILAVATSAVREAKNGGEFALRVWDRLGLHIDVITGTEEARLIFLAATHALNLRRQRAIIVDIGGGSVEIIAGDGNQVGWVESLKLGVVRLTERFLFSDPPEEREILALQVHLDRALDRVFRRARSFRPTLTRRHVGHGAQPDGDGGDARDRPLASEAAQPGAAPATARDRAQEGPGLQLRRTRECSQGSTGVGST